MSSNDLTTKNTVKGDQDAIKSDGKLYQVNWDELKGYRKATRGNGEALRGKEDSLKSDGMS